MKAEVDARRQGGRGVRRCPSRGRPTRRCSPSRCARSRARPTAPATPPRRRSRWPCPRAAPSATSSTRCAGPSSSSWPPTSASSSSARTSARAAACSAPPTAWPPSSAPAASSTRRWPRARSSASASGWRSPACARSPRSSSPTSSTPGFDQLVSEAARIHYRSNGDFSVPLVVRAPWGGGVHGALYHSQSIEATTRTSPASRWWSPSTPADVCGMLRTAIEDADPVLFLEHKKTYRLDLRSRARRRRLARPDRAGRGRPRRRRPHRRHVRAAPPPLPRGGRSGSRTRTARRWRSSTCARSARSTATRCWRRCRAPGAASWCTRTTSASASGPRWPRSWPRRPSGTSTPRFAAWPPPTCRATRSPGRSRASCSSTPPKIVEAMRTTCGLAARLSPRTGSRGRARSPAPAAAGRARPPSPRPCRRGRRPAAAAPARRRPPRG